MQEYLYCVTSPHWDDCKMGIWKGHYADLWARYSLLLGPDTTTITVVVNPIIADPICRARNE